MANGMSQSNANDKLDSDFSTTTYGALVTVAPTATDTGSTITEADYTGYARVAISAADMAAASAGAITNANDISFPTCTAGTDDVVGFVVLDAATGGNVKYFDGDNVTFTVSTTYNLPIIKAGSLDISIA